MDGRMDSALNIIDIINGLLAEVERDTIDADDKDTLKDCMDKLDNVKEVLEDLQI